MSCSCPESNGVLSRKEGAGVMLSRANEDGTMDGQIVTEKWALVIRMITGENENEGQHYNGIGIGGWTRRHGGVFPSKFIWNIYVHIKEKTKYSWNMVYAPPQDQPLDVRVILSGRLKYFCS